MSAPRPGVRGLRIRGLIRLQGRVRDALARGLPAATVEGFRRDVHQALRFVEDACRERGLTLRDLPTPTRAAYEWLRSVDLDALPVAAGLSFGSAPAPAPGGPGRPGAAGGGATPAPARPDVAPAAAARPAGAPRALPPRVRILNLTAVADAFTARLSRVAAGTAPAGVDASALVAEAALVVQRVRRLCEESGGTPGALLPPPSQRAYATVAFLGDPERLAQALETVARLHALARAYRPPQAPPGLVVHLVALGSLYRWQRDAEGGRLRLHLGFLGASDELLGRAARAMHSGAAPGDREAWDEASRSDAFRAVSDELDALLDGARHRPAGRTYDLDALFAALDGAHFRGTLERPSLSWSRAPTRRRLGRYVAAHDHVELSPVLDDPRVPVDAVSYVLFHELLHKRIPGRWEAGRLVIHPPEFRAAERSFPDWQRWDRFLDRFVLESALEAER